MASITHQPARLRFQTEFKLVTAADDDGPRIVEGFANVFAVDGQDFIDTFDDIVLAGSFTKTAKERIPARLVKFMDSHGFTTGAVMGTVISGDEREQDGKLGFWFQAEVSSVQPAQDLATKIDEGHVDRASIGFDPVRVSFEERDGRRIRLIHELRLMEISAVPFAANEESVIGMAKGIIPVQGLPMASTDWDPVLALTRVNIWASVADPAPGSRAARLGKAFVYQGGEDSTQCRLQIGDVVGGQLHVVKGAVIAAARALEGGDHGLPDAAVGDAKRHVAEYLRALALVPPWEARGVVERKLARTAVGAHTEKDTSDMVARLSELDDETKAAAVAALDAGEVTTDGQRETDTMRVELDLLGFDLEG